MLQSITHKPTGVVTQLRSEFMYYGSRSTPPTTARKRPERSGAYLFLPDGPARHFPFNGPHRIYYSRGALVDEYQVHWPEVLHIIRVFKSKVWVSGICNLQQWNPQPSPLPQVEEAAFVWMQNIVDIRAHNNQELVLRFESDIDNKDTFYTDLNGFQTR